MFDHRSQNAYGVLFAKLALLADTAKENLIAVRAEQAPVAVATRRRLRATGMIMVNAKPVLARFTATELTTATLPGKQLPVLVPSDPKLVLEIVFPLRLSGHSLPSSRLYK